MNGFDIYISYVCLCIKFKEVSVAGVPNETGGEIFRSQVHSELSTESCFVSGT